MDHVWIFTTDVPEDELQLLTCKSTDVGDTPSKPVSPSMRQLLKMLLIFLTNSKINNKNLREKAQLKMVHFLLVI